MLLLGHAGTVAAFEQSGNWTLSSLQGSYEYYLHGPKGSRIELYCNPDDPEADKPTYGGNILFTINSVAPPHNALVTLTVDGRKFLFRNPGKTVETNLPCPECSNLAEFWRAVRISKTVEMRLTDGRRVRFASAGGDKILGKDLCQ